jgi:hypothetical protein
MYYATCKNSHNFLQKNHISITIIFPISKKKKRNFFWHSFQKTSRQEKRSFKFEKNETFKNNI